MALRDFVMGRHRFWPAALLAVPLLLWLPPAAAQFLPDDPVVSANLFRNALLDGDRARALSLLAPEVLISENGHQESSREAYASGHLKADMAFLSGIYSETQSQSHQISGDMAWVSTRSKLVSKNVGAEAEPTRYTTETLVLRRSGQGWRIVHVHWSSSTQGTSP